jgi:hypothetical protein
MINREWRGHAVFSATWTAAALVTWLLPALAAAETKLTDLNGTWRGAGHDRNAPWELLQPTHCRTTIRADVRRINAETICDKDDGGRKVIQLSMTVAGDQVTGTVSQRRTVRGSKEPVSVLNGSLSGQRTDTTAHLAVRWSDLTPSTTVALTLNTPSSYSMTVTALGLTMMDVTFRRSPAH